MRHLHRSNVFHKIIQRYGKYPKNIFLFDCASQNYMCPALIFMSNLRMRLNLQLSQENGNLSYLKVMTFKYLKQG